MTSAAPRRKARLLAAAIGVAIVFALALGYAATRNRAPAPPVNIDKLNIALAVLPQGGLLHIAAAKGYFAEEGLEVTLTPVSHGKVGIELMLQGKADLTVAAEVPFVISVLKGEALAIAASMLDMPEGHAVIARRDRGIVTAADLPGKKIGVSFGSSGEYHLWAFLIRHRLAPDSVTLVDVAPGRIAQEIASGSVDATVTWKPLTFDVQAALGENARFLAGDNGYTQMNVLLGRGEFLKARPAAIEKLTRSLLKAEAFTRSRPDEALRLIADWTKADIEVLRPIWQEFHFRIALRQSHLITLEDEARWAMARGYVENAPVPNFLPHLYLDALLAARPERVTVVH